MKASVKRLLDTLDALGFESRPHPYKTAVTVHTHGNDPEQTIKVWAGMSESAATAATRLANRIADTGYAGPALPSSIAERATIRKASEKAQRERQIAETNERVAQKEAEAQARRRRQIARELERGTPSPETRRWVLDGITEEWITPEVIADELCIPLRSVNDAIEQDALTAYMSHGRKVKVKVADVRSWLDTRQQVAS